jgi:hypothetical protein
MKKIHKSEFRLRKIKNRVACISCKKLYKEMYVSLYDDYEVLCRNCYMTLPGLLPDYEEEIESLERAFNIDIKEK